jgi:hypothetical protein
LWPLSLSDRRTLIIAVAAPVGGAASASVGATRDRVDSTLTWTIAGPAVGLNFIATGLYARRRLPDNRTGLPDGRARVRVAELDADHADSDLVHDDAGLTGGRGERSSCTSASGSARPRDNPAGRGDRRRVPGSSRSR